MVFDLNKLAKQHFNKRYFELDQDQRDYIYELNENEIQKQLDNDK